MREANQKSLSQIKADLLARYNLEMDDWTAMVMAENDARFERMNEQLMENQKESQRLNERFKGSVNTIHFKSTLDAFVYGIGRSLPYSITALVFTMLSYVYMSTYKDYKDIRAFVQLYENAFDYQFLISKGKTQTDDGIQYLILKPSKEGKYTFGESYEFDSKRKVVKVPLQSLK